MLIKKIISDIKTYISINYLNVRRYPKSNIQSFIPKSLSINNYTTIRKGVVFSEKVEDWEYKIVRLINDKNLREKLGRNSRILFDANYKFNSQYPILKKVLTK